jgi:hypothetical protein
LSRKNAFSTGAWRVAYPSSALGVRFSPGWSRRQKHQTPNTKHQTKLYQNLTVCLPELIHSQFHFRKTIQMGVGQIRKSAASLWACTPSWVLQCYTGRQHWAESWFRVLHSPTTFMWPFLAASFRPRRSSGSSQTTNREIRRTRGMKKQERACSQITSDYFRLLPVTEISF